MDDVFGYRPPALKQALQGLRNFGDLPAPLQAVLALGAVCAVVLGGIFIWRVVGTVLGKR